jgi:hypothetical protein
MRDVSIGLAGGVMMFVLAAGPAGAIQSKCLASKNTCASKRAFSLLKCEWKAETPGKTPDPNADDCVDKASDKFDGGATPEDGCFEKLENKPENDCLTTDDTATVAALVDQCVGSIVSTIDPGELDQSKCGVSKKKCGAKKLKKLLKCYAKAETPGKPADPNTDGCLDKAKAKFDGGADPEKGCVAKLESNPRNDCISPIGNQADIEAAVDACVDSIIGALETASSSSTTTSSTSSSTIRNTTTSGPGSTSSSTSTSSTTSTSTPTGASCSANGLMVTVSLDYNEQLAGGVSAAHFRVNYAPPLAIPGSGNASTVRARVTKLDTTSTIQGSSIMDNDTNANGLDDALELNALDTNSPLGPGPIFSLRYDCPLGQAISPSAVSCVLSQLTDASGNPHPQPQLIGCTLALSTAP